MRDLTRTDLEAVYLFLDIYGKYLSNEAEIRAILGKLWREL